MLLSIETKVIWVDLLLCHHHYCYFYRQTWKANMTNNSREEVYTELSTHGLWFGFGFGYIGSGHNQLRAKPTQRWWQPASQHAIPAMTAKVRHGKARPSQAFQLSNFIEILVHARAYVQLSVRPTCRMFYSSSMRLYVRPSVQCTCRWNFNDIKIVAEQQRWAGMNWIGGGGGEGGVVVAGIHSTIKYKLR